MVETGSELLNSTPGKSAIEELFLVSLFQPDSVWPLLLHDGEAGEAVILIQCQDKAGNQLRCIVHEEFWCEPHDYSREIFFDANDDPVGLITHGTRTIIDIDSMTARTFEFDAGWNEIQGYFYASEQMVYGGALEPEGYLAAMLDFLKRDVEDYEATLIDQDPEAMKIWEKVVATSSKT